MPRFFCDYCDAYLTHDSAPGRQQHCRGWKHRENFRNYYQKFYAEFALAQQAMHQQQALMAGYGMPMPPAGGMFAPPGMPPGMPPHMMFRPPPGAPPMAPPQAQYIPPSAPPS